MRGHDPALPAGEEGRGRGGRREGEGKVEEGGKAGLIRPMQCRGKAQGQAQHWGGGDMILHCLQVRTTMEGCRAQGEGGCRAGREKVGLHRPVQCVCRHNMCRHDPALPPSPRAAPPQPPPSSALQEKQDNITSQACQDEVFYYELMEVSDFRCEGEVWKM